MFSTLASRRIVSTIRQTRRNMSYQDIFENKNTIKEVRAKYYSNPTPGNNFKLFLLILLKFNYFIINDYHNLPK